MTQRGNVLFLILIAVALFAALSYAVTNSSSGEGKNATDEKAQLDQATLENYQAAMRTGLLRLQIVKGCSSINYDKPADWSGSDFKCHMHHPDGAGVDYQDIGLGSDCNLSALSSVGDNCGSVVYAGTSGGSRLYTTANDTGSSILYSEAETVTGATSETNGFQNTNTLLNLTDTNYPAARACRNLGSAWYLPAKNELQTLFDNYEDIGNFDTTGWPTRMYKSSTEFNAQNAYTMLFPEGTWVVGGHRYKIAGRSVRCVRRD